MRGNITIRRNPKALQQRGNGHFGEEIPAEEVLQEGCLQLGILGGGQVLQLLLLLLQDGEGAGYALMLRAGRVLQALGQKLHRLLHRLVDGLRKEIGQDAAQDHEGKGAEEDPAQDIFADELQARIGVEQDDPGGGRPHGAGKIPPPPASAAELP